jgi:hypothetical protein
VFVCVCLVHTHPISIFQPTKSRQRLTEQEGASAALVAEKNEHKRLAESLAQQLEWAKRSVG